MPIRKQRAVRPNQYLTIEAKPIERVTRTEPLRGDVNVGNIENSVRMFVEYRNRKYQAWKYRLQDLRAHKRKAVIWGLGQKGFTY